MTIMEIVTVFYCLILLMTPMEIVTVFYCLILFTTVMGMATVFYCKEDKEVYCSQTPRPSAAESCQALL